MNIKDHKLKIVKKYNLEYWIGNKHIETLVYNTTKALCNYTLKVLKKSNSYNLGKFKYKQI